jgi:hypothetical protein
MDTLTTFEADVLAHASSNGRYVTGDRSVLVLADRGFLRDYGPQALAAGDHYLTMTPKGREALSTWRAAQPKPPKPKRRRQSPAFEAWRNYREACGHSSFSEFLEKVWPSRRSLGF